MYAYTIQGEISTACAGFPPIVTPRSFNSTNATRHLELFNVKQFIARSSLTKQALRQAPEWRLIGREQDWEMYELTTHEGRWVFIPPRRPLTVSTPRWKDCSLEWLYQPAALSQFIDWDLPPGARAAPRSGHREGAGETLTESQFRGYLSDWATGGTNGMSAVLPEAGTRCIRDEEVTDEHIHFKTTAIGLPHIIKMSWFPNWKVRGADGVHCVSPGFMLVYPRQAEVELYYGTTPGDGVGYALTLVGLALLIGYKVWFRGRRKNS
jgi:hypothetical protein